jgi:hypothetical protein
MAHPAPTLPPLPDIPARASRHAVVDGELVYQAEVVFRAVFCV